LSDEYIGLGWKSSKGMGSFGDKCGASHCSQWELCGVLILCREGSNAALPNLLWDFLLILFAAVTADTTTVTVDTTTTRNGAAGAGSDRSVVTTSSAIALALILYRWWVRTTEQ